MGFDGKVAIVTGAGNGLGREHALALAARGARVVVNDLGGSTAGDGHDRGPAEAVAAEIRSAGGDAVADTNTVSTPEGGKQILQTALDAYGRVDILVNNAGILRDRTFHNLTPADLDAVIDVHLKGTFWATQPVWLKMREQSYGRIVNTSSNSGILGNFGQTNYGAAKMGIVGLTRILALEGAKHNIKVNAIAPQGRTRLTEDLMPAEMATMFDPRLVSPLVVWLAHEDVPVSGETYSAAAGRIARFFIGMTEGFYDPELTAESVRDHFEQFQDATNASIPAGPRDEYEALMRAIEKGR
jgi:NAD(P)-dependent dehydrogenase (short-subunit alcohol dehydrogenase family)